MVSAPPYAARFSLFSHTTLPFMGSQAMKRPRWPPGPGEHPHDRADVRLTGGVLHLDAFIVHADVVGRDVEEAGHRRVGRRLLILEADGGGQMPSPFFFEVVPYFGSLTGTPVSTTPSTGVPVPPFLAQLIGP